ncbi:CBU_0592 family membrane protein [Sinomicrobium weinanense]
MKLLIDIFGWFGSGLVVLAYAISSLEGRKYTRYGKYLNLFGGFLIAINCYYYNAFPSFATNVLWCIIATLTIYKTKKNRYKKNKDHSILRKKPGLKY